MADCRLCLYGERWICEKTDGPMVLMLKCTLFDEYIDMERATDENAICDWYDYDFNSDDDTTEES